MHFASLRWWAAVAAVVMGSLVAAAAEQRLLYAGRAPKNRDGFRHLKPSLEVHDIAAGHKLLRVIPLPTGIFNIRGICASAATQRLYLTHYGTYSDHPHPEKGEGGKLLCLDLVTEKILWEKTLVPSVDRMAITPDGKKLYVPAGEERLEPFWFVVDGLTGETLRLIASFPRAHNTIVAADGRHVFLQAFGSWVQERNANSPSQLVAGKSRPVVADLNPDDTLTHENGFIPDLMRTLAVVDTRTDEIVQRVGPFGERTRPFTVNGRGSLVYMTVDDLVGLQVGDVASGKVLFTAKPPADAEIAPGRKIVQPAATNNGTVTHGIALTADERWCYVVDQLHTGLHVFDVSGLPARAPRWVKFIRTRTGKPEITGQPGWIASTITGDFFYPESGEVVDTAKHEIVGQLMSADGKMTDTRFILEIVRDERGKVLRVSDQFGIGRVGASP